MAKLPLGIQHFPNLRNEGYTYVDKTRLLRQLIEEKPGCFLARPRRFGKSLLVSTLEALFQGKRDLFAGLWIETSGYQWREYPVIRLDLSAAVADNPKTLAISLQDALKAAAARYGIENTEREFPILTFSALVEKLFHKIGPVVVLVDEYDHPLVQHVENRELAEENRKFLRAFYANMKAQEQYLRFVFVTGVTQFTKVSLFSGLNNLQMLSFREEYADLLGLTDAEIKTYFSSNIRDVAQRRGETEEQVFALLKTWYNGYLYAKSSSIPRVYNPISVFSFLKTAQLDNYWFSTATPTLAIALAKQRDFSLLNLEEDVPAGKELEEAHDVGVIDMPTLLYQTGYLTIRKYDERTQTYLLNFPNEEVRRSFLDHLLRVFFNSSPSDIQGTFYKLANYLKRHDVEGFFNVFNLFLETIPHQIHKDAEGYYHSLLYLFLKTLGFKVEAEVSTSQGRIDMVLKTKTDIFVFEFKINKTAQEALDQILHKGYHTQFQMDGRPITLIGVNFDPLSRRLNDWKSQRP